MNFKVVTILALLLFSEKVVIGDTTNAVTRPGWHLAWSDEFDQPNGTAPNPTKWTYDLGGWGWGNNEPQSYTDRRENSRIESGHLVIEVRQETFTGADRLKCAYTSARLTTQGRAAWTYGRMEARMKMPQGQGMWPAFWAMGTNITTVAWPECGEVDIVENIGKEPSIVHGTVHGPGYSGPGGIEHPYKVPGPKKVADDWHVYAINWTTNSITWLVDEHPYAKITAKDLPVGKKWVYNHPFYLLLNLSAGGDWPGYPDATTKFPQQLLVDYVRVWQRD